MSKPTRIRVQGDDYKAVVLRVVESDHNGRPLLLRHVREDEEIQLSADDPAANRFMVVYGKGDCW